MNRHSRSDRITLGLDAGIGMLGGFMVVWYLVLGETLRLSSDSGLAKALLVAYPVGDLVLLFGIAIVVLRHTGDAFWMAAQAALAIAAVQQHRQATLRAAPSGSPDRMCRSADVDAAAAPPSAFRMPYCWPGFPSP